MRSIVGQPCLELSELIGTCTDISLDVQVTLRRPGTQDILHLIDLGEPLLSITRGRTPVLGQELRCDADSRTNG